ncbi:hypothetical protein BKI52_38470 [marine bacterium AO1-C]|nr:hypothetical protein BKI52_38470 [marine bacterium AO1-C]
MEVFTLDNLSGTLEPKQVAPYGGYVSFWQNLRMGGVGSIKLLFKSGNREINHLLETLGSKRYANEHQMPFANFQILSEGLLLRIHAHQIFAIAMHLEEIQRVEITRRKNGGVVLFLNSSPTPIELLVQNLPAAKLIARYFRKRIFDFEVRVLK